MSGNHIPFFLITILSSSLLLFAFAQQPDPCTLQQGNVYSFEQFTNCIQSVPFSETVRQRTIDTLKKATQLYVFKDYARNSPSPFNIQVDLLASLDEMMSINETSDISFHQRLVGLYRKLNDGHTTYLGPKCYSTMVYRQPFDLASYVDTVTSQQRVIITAIVNSTSDYYQVNHGISISKYIGATIQEMDDMPAIDKILSFSNTSMGIYKDYSTRFQIAISNSMFTMRPQQRFDIPTDQNGAIKYKLRLSDGTEETVVIPWVGIPTTSYANTQEFINACTSTQVKSTSAEMVDKKKKKKLIDDDGIDSDMMSTTTTTTVVDKKNEGSVVQQLVKGDMINFYKVTLDNGLSIGVLTIPSFGPSSNAQFAHDFQLSLFEASLNQLDDIIIDLTNNGGGEECLGYALVKYLFPSTLGGNEYDTLFGNSDMVYSELGAALAKAGANQPLPENIWSPANWRSGAGLTFTNDSWFSQNVKEYERGGVKSKFTSYLKENYCQSKFFSHFKFPTQDTKLNLLLLSNGRCGSTCALFSNHLSQSRKVKSAVIGGLFQVPSQIAQVPGGQVYELDEILRDIQYYDLTSQPYAPQPLPTTAAFRFALRETYAWMKGSENLPLEFYFHPTDFRIPYSRQSATDVTQLWKELAPVLMSCASWETRTCQLPNGVGIRSCKDAKFQPECTVTSCQPAYEPTTLMNNCTICQPGFYKSTNGVDQCLPCPVPPKMRVINTTISSTSDVTSLRMSCDNQFECLEGFYWDVEEKTCVAKNFLSNTWIVTLLGITIVAVVITFVVICTAIIFIAQKKKNSSGGGMDEHTSLIK